MYFVDPLYIQQNIDQIPVFELFTADKADMTFEMTYHQHPFICIFFNAVNDAQVRNPTKNEDPSLKR